MPLYDYRCDACGRVFEVRQKFADEPLTIDPECGKGPVERLISLPALQFKGSGFYITDYAKGSAPGSIGKGKSDSSSGSDSSESKASDSKSSDSKSSDSKASDSKSSDSKSSDSKGSSDSKSSDSKSSDSKGSSDSSSSSKSDSK